MSDKITHNKWEESEIEIIKQYYTIYNDKALTKLIYSANIIVNR